MEVGMSHTILSRKVSLSGRSRRAACGIAPTADMNPVLIKPEADSRSQVIVMGRPWQTLEAKNYYEKKKILWGQVTQSLDRLREAHELVIIEGAGSPMELNIKRGDIVNM